MEMFKLIPSVADYIWGGRRLIEEYGIKTDKDPAAEAPQPVKTESSRVRLLNRFGKITKKFAELTETSLSFSRYL